MSVLDVVLVVLAIVPTGLASLLLYDAWRVLRRELNRPLDDESAEH